MKNVFMGAGAIVLLFAVILGLDYGLGVGWFGFIEPKKEDVRREIFLNTRSYIEGKTQDLLKYRLEYMRASGDEKEALANTIRHSFAEFDENKLESAELHSFLKNIKYGVVQ